MATDYSKGFIPRYDSKSIVNSGYQGRSPSDEYFYDGNADTYRPSFNMMRNQNLQSTLPKRNFSALNLSPLQKQNIINESYTRNNLPIPTSPISNQKMIEMANARGQTSQGNVRQDGTPPNLKNNLLNYIASPHGKGMAQGLLEASGYSEVPVTFGQALSMGMKRGTEANASAAASQLAKDKFAYEQKQDAALNWLKLKEILSKDSRTNIEKKMTAMFPKLIPGSTEYAEQAMKILKSGAMTVNLKDTPQGAGWLKLEEGTAQKLVDTGNALSTKWNESSGSLDQISKLRQALMPLDESQFGKTAKFKMGVGNFLQSIGIPINEENQAMVESVFALGGEFVMGQIQNTKGAVSEKEMAYFDNISPSLSKTKGGMLLLLDLSKYALEEDKRRLVEWNKYQDTWTEDMSMSKIMSGWNDILINMKSEVPAKTKTAIENLVYNQSIKDIGDTNLILDPKNETDLTFINQELGKANDGEGFISSQFIGFTDNGLPKYLVETSENVFKKLVVNKD
tara:strand:+ start:34 stop:1563 length:1530 start_codon:yes stop_codon:yes gene_type:complete